MQSDAIDGMTSSTTALNSRIAFRQSWQEERCDSRRRCSDSVRVPEVESAHSSTNSSCDSPHVGSFCVFPKRSFFIKASNIGFLVEHSPQSIEATVVVVLNVADRLAQFNRDFVQRVTLEKNSHSVFFWFS